MARFKYQVYFAFFVLSVLLIVMALIYLHRQHISEDIHATSSVSTSYQTSSTTSISPIEKRVILEPIAVVHAEVSDPLFEEVVNRTVTEQILDGSYEIYGSVFEPTPDTIENDLFTKLETAESLKEFYQILHRVHLSELPAAGVTVTLQSGSFIAKVVTNAEGKYNFVGIPSNRYTLSTEKMGQKQLATAKKTAHLESDSKMNLRLRDDLVTIKGRIIDAYGRPIAGAIVTGTKAPFNITEGLESLDPDSISAISKSDGSYELSGVAPPSFFHVFCYLLSGQTEVDGFYVDIRIKADALATGKSKVLRVPLVTEKQLDNARQFLNAYNHVAQRSGEKLLQEKQDLSHSLLSSLGNIITVSDIIPN